MTRQVGDPIIATVTLNPACDQALTIPDLELGEVNRCQLESLDPGGKGINASRMVHRLGRPTLAFGFVGGVTGELIRRRLTEEGVPHDLVELPEATRLNVMIRETSTGRRTRIYAPGAAVEPTKLGALRAQLAALPKGSLVVLGGSVPPGLDHRVYRDLVGSLRARGLPVVLDASDDALLEALGARPTLVKPNAEEAGAVLGRKVDDEETALEAAQEMRRRGAEHVVISLGERGAVAVGDDGWWRVVPPWISARSTVGSGDSMVAGLAIGLFERSSLVDALRLGAAAGAATAMTCGTQLGAVEEVRRLLPRVVVTDLGHHARPAA